MPVISHGFPVFSISLHDHLCEIVSSSKGSSLSPSFSISYSCTELHLLAHSAQTVGKVGVGQGFHTSEELLRRESAAVKRTEITGVHKDTVMYRCDRFVMA